MFGSSDSHSETTLSVQTQFEAVPSIGGTIVFHQRDVGVKSSHLGPCGQEDIQRIHVQDSADTANQLLRSLRENAWLQT